MSQPNRDIDLSFSPDPRPSFSKPSFTPSFSSVPQSIFNQKLIPRDFLGNRSKTLPESVLNLQNGVSGPLFATNPFQSNRNVQAKETKDVRDRPDRDPVSPVESSTLERNIGQNNDLNNLTTAPPQSVQYPDPTNKARSASYGGPISVDVELFTNLTMPRTSSIDSAISNVSTSSLSRAAGELRDPSPTSVRNLIATAGGAENLVTHLLREKNTVASQNAQLWKLVEKQRSLLLGLNKDLDRITKERDKFRKRVKELEIHTINEDGEIQGRASTSPDRVPLSTANIAAPNRGDSKPAQYDDEGKRPLPFRSPEIVISPHTEHDQVFQNKDKVVVQPRPEPIMPANDNGRSSNPDSSFQESTIRTPDSATFSVTDASPGNERSGKSFASTRKAPPKPLNLTPGVGDGFAPNQFSAKDQTVAGEEIERGRRRTREEDDRDREASAMKAEAEAEARSRSKKNKIPKAVSGEENQVPPQTQVPAPLPTPGLPLSPRPQHAQTFVAPSVHLTASNIPQTASLNERLFAAPLKSPGLPLSPRPFNNAPLGTSLPLSPRANMGAFPLSPRAPKTALPMPTNLAAPVDAAALQKQQSRGYQSSPQNSSSAFPDRLQVHQPVGSDAPPVYRGLAVSAYPNLLLPPNALPSIKVQVHSSRLRPSRHAALSIKNQEEITIFSLSVISRSSNSELWRVEKMPGALPQLELQLRPRCPNLPKMPDRRLFAGQSPVLLDERRVAVDNYFEELLDIHIDEIAAVAICTFLSTDVIDPEQVSRSASNTSDPSVTPALSRGQQAKTGYLTKKGKNFGGWKSRFFILEGPELRYYDAAGGPHLGTIRLQNALIGKQKDNDSNDDADGQYRHAFLIQEPKRKDSGNFIRHVLCAESDSERDEWVRALLYWVEGGATSRNGSQDLDADSRYSGAKAGSSSKETRDTHTNTPTPTSGSSIDSSLLDQSVGSKQTGISAPLNGGVITDNSPWGLKSPTSISYRETKDKTHKMSNIFGFKRPEPSVALQDQKPPKPRILRHNGYVRPVFGLPLAEAVEFCAPFNVEVDLPAVVYRSIEYLRYRNAANEEGLFRLSGSNVVVRNLKDRFNSEGDIDLVSEDEYHDVHAVASLFKTYLRELPSTLLTRDLHIEFIKVLELESNSEKVVAFNSLVHRLPPANFSLLREMSRYLLEVTENAGRNKMSVRNVGIVFSPTLNIPTPVFNLFLTDYAAIFERESSQASNTRVTEVRAPASLTPDDIRSPRHQMFSNLPTPAYNQTTFHGMTSMAPPRGTMTGTGDMGFMSLDQIYAASSQISPPRQSPPAQLNKPMTQVADAGGYSSLNSLLASSTNAPTDKATKRQSAVLF